MAKFQSLHSKGLFEQTVINTSEKVVKFNIQMDSKRSKTTLLDDKDIVQFLMGIS